MNNLIKSDYQLPDTIEDLSKFVLVNEERIQALRAEIRAIKKVSLAKEVYEQKLAEAQEVGQMTVEAAQKMGELLLQIQKQNGNQYTSASPTDAEKQKTKTEITSEMGMTSQQVSQYQQMAQNPEAVQAAIQKAIENGDVVSRSQVMKEIREMKEKIKTLEDIRDTQAMDKVELRKRISELEKNPKVKEVAPSDYKEAKSKARAYDAETNRLNQKIAEMAKQRNELEDKIRELQMQTAQEQSKGSLLSDCIYFVSQCGFFINNVAGYVWLADKLADLPEKEREQYVRATSAVRDWAVALLQSIERDEQYGKPEIRKLIEESTREFADG